MRRRAKPFTSARSASRSKRVAVTARHANTRENRRQAPAAAARCALSHTSLEAQLHAEPRDGEVRSAEWKKGMSRLVGSRSKGFGFLLVLLVTLPPASHRAVTLPSGFIIENAVPGRRGWP